MWTIDAHSSWCSGVGCHSIPHQFVIQCCQFKAIIGHLRTGQQHLLLEAVLPGCRYMYGFPGHAKICFSRCKLCRCILRGTQLTLCEHVLSFIVQKCRFCKSTKRCIQNINTRGDTRVLYWITHSVSDTSSFVFWFSVWLLLPYLIVLKRQTLGCRFMIIIDYYRSMWKLEVKNGSKTCCHTNKQQT